MSANKPGKLLWIDLEMTGLDPDKQKIVEVAAVITDWDFKVLAEYHTIVHQSEAVLKNMDPWCVTNHKSTGLLDLIESGADQGKVDSELAKIVEDHCELPVILAGNSVHFDRRFIRRYMPKVEKLLHYRILDVSAWKLVMMNKYDVEFRKREAHRALDDIKGSIEELQYYLKILKK